MAKEVFDQARPRSIKAQLFAEAFAGCDEWIVPPRKRRTAPDEVVFDSQAIRLRDYPSDLRRAA
jgi:hypothetical protein